MDTGRLNDLLRKGLPVSHGGLLVNTGKEGAEAAADGTLTVCLEVYAASGEMYGQRISLVPASALRDAGRVEAYVLAWMRALPSLMARRLERDEPGAVLPGTLVFSEALTHRDAASQAEFAALFADPDALLALEMLRDEAEFRRDCEWHGLGEHAASLAALRRSTIALVPGREGTGRSRVGGVPDLPPGASWPHGRERPMVFLAQIDLDAASEYDADGLLPRSGLLQVFVDLSSTEPWFEDGGRNAVRVLVQGDEPHRLSAARPPAGCEVFPDRPVGFASDDVCMPPLESPFYERLVARAPTAGMEEWRPVLEFLNEFHPPLGERDEPRHLLLGYPDPLQGDPWRAGREAEPDTPVEDWQLLVQIDSEPDALLGDNGLVYVMIPRDALAAEDFTRARAEWQMH